MSGFAKVVFVTLMLCSQVFAGSCKICHDDDSGNSGSSGTAQLGTYTVTASTGYYAINDPGMETTIPFLPVFAGIMSVANKTARAIAKSLGYTKRIPAQKVPFNSHGKPAFKNRKGTHITRDVDAHLGPDAYWKMFSRKSERLGTYDKYLKRRLGD